LTSVKVFTVFWGGAWEQQPVRDTVGQINQFFETILSSELMDQLTEYNVPGQQIGHGTWIGSATVDAGPFGGRLGHPDPVLPATADHCRNPSRC
jgi:hypothetical protein